MDMWPIRLLEISKCVLAVPVEPLGQEPTLCVRGEPVEVNDTLWDETPIGCAVRSGFRNHWWVLQVPRETSRLRSQRF